MVGIFSRFSFRGSHRRTQSSLDDRDTLPPNSEVTTATTLATSASAITHGIEMAIEFKPLEHPNEPLDYDQPIQCPLPEPSILNDGRIWKERVSSGVQRRVDMPIMHDDQNPIEPETQSMKPRPRPRPNRVILPSISAPEHSILKLLEECNVSGL